MRIVFCGSPPEAAASLAALHEAGHQIVAVVTRPERPKGRGRKVEATAVAGLAAARGLACRQPDDVHDPVLLASLAALRPDLLVVVAFGVILRRPLLELAPQGSVNVHFSLLPELRGAAPVEWAVVRGLAETGVTTMFMNEQVDAGEIILTARTPIGPDETAGELRGRLSALGAELLVRTAALITAGGPVPRMPQDASRATRAPRLTAERARIDWSRPAAVLHDHIRGFNPRPGATARLGGEEIKVWRSRRAAMAEGTGAAVVATHGEIMAIRPDGLLVACGEGALLLTELQAPGRRALGGAQFARGRHLAPGGRFETAAASSF